MRDERAERALAAQINLHQLRGWRLSSLRWAVAASLVFWLQAHGCLLPGLLVWLGGLVEATALALATVYAVLEHQWTGRAARLRAQGLAFAIHAPWNARHQVRSGLWYGLAVVSALPLMAAMGERPLPSSLLWYLTGAALTVLGLLAASQTSAWGARGGTVLAVDVRRLPLLVLRVRAALRANRNVKAVHADARTMDLPTGGVDAVLIAERFVDAPGGPWWLVVARKSIVPRTGPS